MKKSLAILSIVCIKISLANACLIGTNPNGTCRGASVVPDSIRNNFNNNVPQTLKNVTEDQIKGTVIGSAQGFVRGGPVGAGVGAAEGFVAGTATGLLR